MDPVSHVAFGRTLIALDAHRTLGPGAIAACVHRLADARSRRGVHADRLGRLPPPSPGRHALADRIDGLRGADRGRRQVVCRNAVDYLPLLLAAWAGAVGHLLLDVISGADVRFFWPLGPPVALPLFAMADPWLGGVLVLGLVTLALRKRNSGRVAAAILIAVTVLAVSKAALYARAHAVEQTSAGAVQFRRAEAEWGSLTRWITYETRADVVDARRVNAWTGTITPLIQRAAGPERSPRRHGPGSWRRCRTFLRRTALRSRS